MTDESYRVLVFATAFPPAAVGTSMYAHSLSRGLAEAGSEVLVLAPEYESGGAAAFDRDQAYQTVRMPLGSFVPLRYLQARKWLCRVLREFRPDTLWTTNGMTTRVAGLLTERDTGGVPVVSCMRGSDLVTRLPGTGLWARLESVPQRRCYDSSAAIAAASEFLRQIAVRKGIDREKVFVHRDAFDCGQLEGYQYESERLLRRYPFLERRRMVLTVARLTTQKRVNLTVRAVAQVVKRVPELCYVVVGDGPDRVRIRQLIDELGVADHIYLVGSVPPMSAELYDLYSRAQVFVMTSVAEGLGNVFLEAGAFGLPSVGSNDGGVPEVIVHGQTGLLAAVDDVEEIAQKVECMLLDPAASRRMGVQARQRIAERFSTEAMAERSLRVLQAVAEGTWPSGTGGAA